jgi:protein SCO1/2
VRRLAAAGLAALVLLVACGGGDDADRELAGYRREPAPEVGGLALPDLTDDGAELPLRAEPGGLLVVYFGYTNCPDFCPTTLSDLRLATRRMSEEDAARIEVAMVTIDPDRDLPVLADYITSFFDDGHALGTTDAALLASVAAPFGVTYDVRTGDTGEIEVAHTTSLYAIDDTGRLVLTWQFGVPIDDLAADLTALLAEERT